MRGKSLILNLPGKPKAIRETIDEVCLNAPPQTSVFCIGMRFSDALIVMLNLVVYPGTWAL